MTYWLIHFEDAEIQDEVFTDGEAARKRWEALNGHWSCTPFVQADRLDTLESENATLAERYRLIDGENDMLRQDNARLAARFERLEIALEDAFRECPRLRRHDAIKAALAENREREE